MLACRARDGNWWIPIQAEDEDGRPETILLEVPPDHPEAVRWARWYETYGIPPPEDPGHALRLR